MMTTTLLPLLLAMLAPAQLDPGATRAAAERAIPEARWLEKSTAGALAEGLVKSRLLETLNRFDLAPRDPTRALDSTAFSAIAIWEKQNRKYVAAFDAQKLRYLLIRIPIPVDPKDQSPRRLHRLREAIAELDLKPKEKDRYGNTFTWQNKNTRAIYLPEEDELRVLKY